MAENEVASDETTADATATAETEAPEMEPQIAVEAAGPCKKHVKITVPRAEIDRILDSQVEEFVGEAVVPGFRPGHVPDALVRKRFRTELSDRVKQRVLMLSLEQIAQSDEVEPINEPTLDIEGIQIPEEGDFTFEFDVEVRPEFDLPDYKGLKINRFVREVTDEDVESYTAEFLEQYAHLVPVDEPAQTGDSVIVDVEFTHNGERLRSFEELTLRLRPVLRFHDAELEGFDKLMEGVTADETREADLTISMESDQIAMRGETVHAVFKVLDVKRPEAPELNEEFLERIGVESVDELKEQFRTMLERQIQYEQRQSTREQVLEKILQSADWDLPEDLLRKQVENAFRRELLELQQAGFTTAEIRARESQMRQESLTTTRRNLKQHFVLDRIAEEEGIEVTSTDIESEILIMAMQSGENPRRVRSRLIKSGMIENLEAQIRERKAVDVILDHAEFTDVEMPPLSQRTVETVNRFVCGESVDASSATEDEEE